MLKRSREQEEQEERPVTKKTTTRKKTRTTPNGVYISNVNRIIRQISGPVSLYYLIPNPNKMIVVKRPLIMLFGDYHFSKKNMCQPCFSQKGCYRIADTKFFKMLNSIGGGGGGVHFYTETFVDAEQTMSLFETGFAKGPLGDVISRNKNFFPFHKNYDEAEKRAIYPNIEFHAADARFSTMKDVSGTRRMTLEQALMFPAFHIPTYDQHESINPGYDYFKSMDDVHKKACQTIWDASIRLINDVYVFFPSIFADVFFDMYENPVYNSLIFKQTKKQINDVDWKSIMKKLWHLSFSTYATYATMYYDRETEGYIIPGSKDYIHFKSIFIGKYGSKEMFDFLTHYEDINDFVGKFEKLTLSDVHIKNIKNTEYDDKVKTARKTLEHFFTYINSAFVDLYFLMRIFKIPDRGSRAHISPTLIVGYFGNAHTVKLTKILAKEFGYQIDYRKDSNADDRCITITKNIDVLSDAAKYSSYRMKHKKTKKKSAKKTKTTKKTKKATRKKRK
jgi:hypothetical protein